MAMPRPKNKVKIHLWRAFHEALPAKSHLACRGIKTSTQCSRCYESGEDTTHALWSCDWVIQVWEQSSIWPVLRKFRRGSFSDLCLFISSRLSKEEFEIFFAGLHGAFGCEENSMSLKEILRWPRMS